MLPGVYSLIVPVVSAPALGSGLLLVGWAQASPPIATKATAQRQIRLNITSPLDQRCCSFIRTYQFNEVETLMSLGVELLGSPNGRYCGTEVTELFLC